MKATLLSLLVLTAVVYAGLCILLYVFQRSLMYFPTPAASTAPAEELQVANEGEELRIWRVQTDRALALLYFGGNAENVALNIHDFRELFPQHAIYLVNYRGYGGSSGTPSERALYSDAEAVFDRVAAEHRSVAVIGRSLGSAVATWLANRREVSRLALITPADSFTSLARRHYPLFPAALLLKDRYDSLSRAGSIEVPVLFVVAEKDEIIPPESSRRLAAAMASARVSFEVVPGAGHNTIGLAPRFRAALARFLAEDAK